MVAGGGGAGAVGGPEDDSGDSYMWRLPPPAPPPPLFPLLEGGGLEAPGDGDALGKEGSRLGSRESSREGSGEGSREGTQDQEGGGSSRPGSRSGRKAGTPRVGPDGLVLPDGDVSDGDGGELGSRPATGTLTPLALATVGSGGGGPASPTVNAHKEFFVDAQRARPVRSSRTCSQPVTAV